MKVCTKCKEEKNVSLFNINRKSKDGYSYHCKECHSSYVKRKNILNVVPEFPNGMIISNLIDFKKYIGYAVDLYGHIWSCKTNKKGYYKCWERMNETLSHNGYVRIGLYDYTGELKHFPLHRIVAISFIPNPNNKIEINHRDCCKTNNHVNNLEWCTHSENILHSVRMGTHPDNRGEKHGMSKLKDMDIPEIFNLNTQGVSKKKIGVKFNVSPSTICAILKRKKYKHVNL